MKKFLWPTLAILWALLTLNLTTTPNLVVAPETWLNSFIMSGSHFGFFGVQAVLLYFALPTITYNLSPITSILVTSAFGYWIEVMQLSIPGRSYDLVDWALDTLGAMIFVLVINYYLKPKSYNL